MQEVVEVVGDAAAHAAERFHLLRLGELGSRLVERLLLLEPLGEIPRDLGEAQ